MLERKQLEIREKATDTTFVVLVYLHLTRCVRLIDLRTDSSIREPNEALANGPIHSVQVNIPAESGEMGILAQHVPSIEQLKPGLVEIIEESGGNKQFFRTFGSLRHMLSAEEDRGRRMLICV